MRTLQADRKMPDTGGWQDRHDAAIARREPSVPDMEYSVTQMLKAWSGYAAAHRERYDSAIGDDGVLGAEWEAVGDGIRGLLNGETGRLDCGTLDGFILDTMRENGIDVDNK